MVWCVLALALAISAAHPYNEALFKGMKCATSDRIPAAAPWP
jgi:hypothetical protein